MCVSVFVTIYAEIKVGGSESLSHNAGGVSNTDGIDGSVIFQDVVVHLEPSSASHWVSQWGQSSTVLTTQVRLHSPLQGCFSGLFSKYTFDIP